MITKEKFVEALEDAVIPVFENVADTFYSTVTIKADGEMTWQVKAMLNPQEVKLKTSDQKEVSQEDQPEQESSIPSNDQTLPEKEQRLKTKNTSNIQFVVSHPDGETVVDGEYISNYELAQSSIERLREGMDIILPPKFSLYIIERNDL